MKNKRRTYLILILSAAIILQSGFITLPTVADEQQTLNAQWTMMMYFNGDNKLQTVMQTYLSLIRQITFNPMVQLVVLIDGKSPGDTNLYHIHENTLVNLEWEDESDMDDANTLEQFIQTSRTEFPASYYGLFIGSNKGSGWQGLCYDEHGDGIMITMPELHSVMKTVTQNGEQPIDILGIESCMTGNTELAYEIKDYVRYFIAGPECGIVVPAQGIGFPYQESITDLVEDPEMSPQELSMTIVSHFIPINEPSLQTKTNLVAMDCTGLSSLAYHFNDLAQIFKEDIESYKPLILDALEQSKIFGELWGITYMVEPYDFLDHLTIETQEFQTIKNDIQQTITSSIIAKKTVSSDPVYGLNLYFPRQTPDYNHALRYDSGILPSPYEETQFAQDTQWDEFLKTMLGIAYNTAPLTPTIEGPNETNSGEQCDIQFSAIDPDGDDILFYIDWGDGTESTWHGPYPSDQQISISHTWQQQGSITIRAKVKDSSDAESDWESLSLSVSKTKTKPYTTIRTILIGKISDIEENIQGGIRFLPIRLIKMVFGSTEGFSLQMIDESYGGYPCCSYIFPEDFKGILSSTFICGCWYTNFQ